MTTALTTTSPIASGEISRDVSLRAEYLRAATAVIPRLLASVDRNPYGPSYGSCDRQFWHYRTASFPSEMYQEAALPLALAFTLDVPGNAWFGEARLAEAAVAALRFSAKSAHRDGSCDDYYPFERALGAAVFSLQAQTAAYRLLGLNDPSLVRFFARRAKWIAEHDESGRLSNHHALAALGLWRTWRLTGDRRLREASLERVEQLLQWQSPEGWFDEYGGADPGYQTVTIDCLAKLRREARLPHLDEPLDRALAFARAFLHPDDGYGGEYGSRGTRHFYPHGFELLAAENSDAADLADGFLRSLNNNGAAAFDDDRMVAHRVASLLEAYRDWTPERPAAARARHDSGSAARVFSHAGLAVVKDEVRQVIVSAARGGSFQCFVRGDDRWISHVDAGLVVETADGRIAVSQTHRRDREVAWGESFAQTNLDVTVGGELDWVRFERATPWKQAVLHLGMLAVGRFARGAVRKLLQQRTIFGGGRAPIRLTRRLRLVPDSGENSRRLVVEDTVELTEPNVQIRRLAAASDLQAAYTAASNVACPELKQPWTDLSRHVERLNRERRVTIVRKF